MSGKSIRPPLRGMIYDGDAIVGGVDLNEPDEPFVEQFNREYARLGLRIAPRPTPRQPGETPRDGGPRSARP